ncbi:MAG: hypothetical protein HLUCCA11_23485 [Phormidesmis priestleyi Ana]|uniref:Uncharacterized protein n=1 Tax=Phormidesmis priestleyi Ana TaxID=1666911 RepID=A0A0N8KLQ3_9CYAN|nr:MAG: hypothetical protein HLUCCA11_23485 [Phormidesmis priestleyi Ana]
MASSVTAFVAGSVTMARSVVGIKVSGLKTSGSKTSGPKALLLVLSDERLKRTKEIALAIDQGTAAQ